MATREGNVGEFVGGGLDGDGTVGIDQHLRRAGVHVIGEFHQEKARRRADALGHPDGKGAGADDVGGGAGGSAHEAVGIAGGQGGGSEDEGFSDDPQGHPLTGIGPRPEIHRGIALFPRGIVEIEPGQAVAGVFAAHEDGPAPALALDDGSRLPDAVVIAFRKEDAHASGCTRFVLEACQKIHINVVWSMVGWQIDNKSKKEKTCLWH